MVGRHTINELLGIAPQLLDLAIDTDQVGQAHVEADVQWQQIATAPVALPTRGQALRPVDSGSRRRQQWLDSGQDGVGSLKKSIQSGIHDFSSDTFTVKMAKQ
jgi:hypothetical protein